MNIQHSSRTDAWGTPRQIVEAARTVLGSIDFDPASDQFFNQTVKARHYFTKEDDGLKSVWPVDVAIFVNPPGGKTKNRSNTALFWGRLMDHLQMGFVKHSVFLAFSLEALQTTQGSARSMLEFPICVPKKRIAFVTPEGLPGKAPSHSNVIVYVPGQVDNTEGFVKAFSEIGKCAVPRSL